jgi:hypothetical protein
MIYGDDTRHKEVPRVTDKIAKLENQLAAEERIHDAECKELWEALDAVLNFWEMDKWKEDPSIKVRDKYRERFGK